MSNIKNKFFTNDEETEYYDNDDEAEEHDKIDKENLNYELDTALIIKKELLNYTEYLPICEYLSENSILEFMNIASNYTVEN